MFNAGFDYEIIASKGLVLVLNFTGLGVCGLPKLDPRKEILYGGQFIPPTNGCSFNTNRVLVQCKRVFFVLGNCSLLIKLLNAYTMVL